MVDQWAFTVDLLSVVDFCGLGLRVHSQPRNFEKKKQISNRLAHAPFFQNWDSRYGYLTHALQELVCLCRTHWMRYFPLCPRLEQFHVSTADPSTSASYTAGHDICQAWNDANGITKPAYFKSHWMVPDAPSVRIMLRPDGWLRQPVIHLGQPIEKVEAPHPIGKLRY
jgi:hypothetical protein